MSGVSGTWKQPYGFDRQGPILGVSSGNEGNNENAIFSFGSIRMDFETPANVEFYNPLRLLEQDLLRTACLKKKSQLNVELRNLQHETLLHDSNLW